MIAGSMHHEEFTDCIIALFQVEKLEAHSPDMSQKQTEKICQVFFFSHIYFLKECMVLGNYRLVIKLFSRTQDVIQRDEYKSHYSDVAYQITCTEHFCSGQQQRKH